MTSLYPPDPDRPEDQFATDAPATDDASARARLRILSVFGFFTAGYGLLLKGIVPLVTGLLRGDPVEELAQNGSLAWLPVALIARWLTHPSRHRIELAFVTGVGGFGYYLVGFPYLLLHLPPTGDYGVFSRVYYGIWAAGFFATSLFILGKEGGRPGPEGQNTGRTPLAKWTIGASLGALIAGGALAPLTYGKIESTHYRPVAATAEGTTTPVPETLYRQTPGPKGAVRGTVGAPQGQGAIAIVALGVPSGPAAPHVDPVTLSLHPTPQGPRAEPTLMATSTGSPVLIQGFDRPCYVTAFRIATLEGQPVRPRRVLSEALAPNQLVKVPPLEQPGVYDLKAACAGPEVSLALWIASPSPYFTLTAVGDTFTLTDLPPGEIHLAGWQRGEAGQPIHLAGKAAVTPDGVAEAHLTAAPGSAAEETP